MSIAKDLIEDNLALIALDQQSLDQLKGGARTSHDRRDTTLQSIARLRGAIAELEAANAMLELDTPICRTRQFQTET